MKNFTLNRNHTDYKKLIFSLALLLMSAGFAFAQNATNGGAIGNNQSICPGETPAPLMNITPASGGNTSASIEYLWMYGTSASFPGAGWQIAPGVNNQATYNTPAVGSTTYFIRCARRSGFTAFQAESNVVTITALPSPYANITGLNSNVFSGFTANVTASYSPNSTYAWDFNGDGFPDCFGQNCSYTYNFPGTFNTTLTVTNGFGCESITTVTVTVSAPSAANISDPCNCGNPANLFTPTTYYNNDYVLIMGNPGETWIYTNTGATVYNMGLNPIPSGTVIPEVQPGVYFLNLWFEGGAGGWSGMVTNGAVNLGTGPGPGLVCPPCFNPLPVDLISFDGYAQDDETVLLKWSTATETDNDYFEIEASTDGARFDVIAQVEGAGTALTQQNYSFTDENPADGINYYRLKQIDTDGTINYFNDFISVEVSRDSKVFQVTPNPVKNVARIQLTDNLSAEAHIELVSVTGSIIKVIDINAYNSVQEIIMSDVAAGVYFVRLVDRLSNEVLNQRIVKQ